MHAMSDSHMITKSKKQRSIRTEQKRENHNNHAYSTVGDLISDIQVIQIYAKDDNQTQGTKNEHHYVLPTNPNILSQNSKQMLVNPPQHLKIIRNL